MFLKLLQVLGTRRAPRDRIDAWLYRVAHNLAMDQYRREKKMPAIPLDEDVVAGGSQPADIVDEKMTNQQLRAGIRRLTTDQQRVILLRFAEERPLAEVARMMGKSEGAIKTLQHRAVSRLRKLLGD